MDTAGEVLGPAAEDLSGWQARLRGLSGPAEECLRVAVAGTVKSGKSTLVNALLGRDLLKRGAGIITSLVTRIRPGDALGVHLRLKGWEQINREVTEAALFLREAEDAIDLRAEADRRALHALLAELGEDALGEGGFLDRNVALLRAYLAGYPRVEALLGEGPRDLDFGPSDFERHREFAGDDAQAAYVDNLVLEVPDLPYPGAYELADCQGYDSPNPRHMEKVQEYLLGAHLVVYVVSSRVGLREADLRFLRDIKAMGLAESTRVVLNADLGEHGSEEDLSALAERVRTELEPLLEKPSLHIFSALRALLQSLRAQGAALSRKEELLLELWSETTATDLDDFAKFQEVLGFELGERRTSRLEAARTLAIRGSAEALRSRIDAALALARGQAASYQTEGESLREARLRVERSLTAFEDALGSLAGRLRARLFRDVDGVFHPSGGSLAVEVLARLADLEPPGDDRDAPDRQRLFRQMARIYQEMRAAFHRYKVETVNPAAVERIRTLWSAVSREFEESAGAPADLLVESVEAYRREAGAFGIDLPPLERPDLAPRIGRRTIPLFSAVTYASPAKSPERLASFAGQWTRKLALGWAYRLVGKKERTGFVRSLLADGADAVRDLLAEEARSNLLQYNEQLKYQVLGKSLDELVRVWSEAYRETVEALVLDLDKLAAEVERVSTEREDLVPRLQGILDALDPLAA